MITDLVIVVSAFVVVIFLPHFAKCGPDILTILLEGRGLASMENNLKMVRSRNICIAALYMPFCLAVGWYGLVDLDVFQAVPEDLLFLPRFGIITAYFLVKIILYLAFRPKKSAGNGYALGRAMARTIFIPMTCAILIATGVLALVRPGLHACRITLLSVIVLFYLVLLWRYYHILRTSASHFTTFLYLCGLEICPTALTVALIEWL